METEQMLEPTSSFLSVLSFDGFPWICFLVGPTVGDVEPVDLMQPFFYLSLK